LDIVEGKLQHLKNLNLGWCEYLTDGGLKKLINATGGNLELLDLDGTRISGESLDIVEEKLQHLKNLDFQACKTLTDAGLKRIINSTGGNLELLVLNGTKISGESLDILEGKLQHLRNLKLCCWYLTDGGLKKIILSTGGNLELLELNGIKVSGESLDIVEGKLQHLKSLKLISCKNLTDGGLKKIIDATGGNLELLDLIGSKISGESLDIVEGKLQHLKSLNLKWCKNLTDAGLKKIINSTGGNLELLALCGTGISRESLNIGKGKLLFLKNLNLKFCKNLTDAGLKIMKSCKC